MAAGALYTAPRRGRQRVGWQCTKRLRRAAAGLAVPGKVILRRAAHMEHSTTQRSRARTRVMMGMGGRNLATRVAVRPAGQRGYGRGDKFGRAGGRCTALNSALARAPARGCLGGTRLLPRSFLSWRKKRYDKLHPALRLLSPRKGSKAPCPPACPPGHPSTPCCLLRPLRPDPPVWVMQMMSAARTLSAAFTAAEAIDSSLLFMERGPLFTLQRRQWVGVFVGGRVGGSLQLKQSTPA